MGPEDDSEVPWRKDLDVRGTGVLGVSGKSVSSMLDPSSASL
jgi:hypothetical protein